MINIINFILRKSRYYYVRMPYTLLPPLSEIDVLKAEKTIFKFLIVSFNVIYQIHEGGEGHFPGDVKWRNSFK